MTSLIEEAGDLQDRLTGTADWRQIVQMVTDLPPLPRVALEAMKLLDDPNVTPVKITDLISQDAALASRLLKVANSAMFSRRARVSTLSQAIMMVGFKTLRGLIIAASVRELLRSETELDKYIWGNSMLTAVTAGNLARELKHPYHEETFTYGLLHDVGKLVLLSSIRAPYLEAMKGVCAGKTYAEVEQETFGYTHALVGALVAKKWNFPTELCQVLLHHHDPVESPITDPMMIKTAIVQAADLVSHAVGVGHPEGYPELQSQAEWALVALGMPADKATDFIGVARDIYSPQASGSFE